MIPLVTRRSYFVVKLIVSSVCCNRFLALWGRSIIEVSFYAEALEPQTIDIIMVTVYALFTPMIDSISNFIDVFMWQNRFRFIQSRCRQSISSK